MPTISTDEILDLVEARHPLLEENLRAQNEFSPQRRKDAEEEFLPQIGTDKRGLSKAETRPSGSVSSSAAAKDNTLADARVSAQNADISEKNQVKEIVPVTFTLTKEKGVMIISGAISLT